MRQIPEYELYRYREKKSKYCICIPVINEGNRIRSQLQRMKDLDINRISDILICDGGSDDGSLQEDFLRSCGVSVLLVKTGPGMLGAQLRMGYGFALDEGYDGILTIDGNNKDDPKAVYEFIGLLEEGYDYIQGSRFIKGGRGINTPLLRLLAIRLIHAPVISTIAGTRLTDTTNGFRAYSHRVLSDPVLDIFRDIFNGYELLAYLSAKIPRMGYRVTEHPVVRKYPRSGKVPTKIRSWQSWLNVLLILWHLAAGKYSPRT
jgi:glycosyltransferase involved in cell wall biosynthesis